MNSTITSEEILDFNIFPDVEKPSNCPICQEPFLEEDVTQKPVTIPCGHAFHTACLAFLFVPVGVTDWNEDYDNGKCPLCQTQLFHLKYKFYTEEMVEEREGNLKRELHLYHERLSQEPLPGVQEEIATTLSRETTSTPVTGEEITVYRHNSPLQRRRRHHAPYQRNQVLLNQEEEPLFIFPDSYR